MLEVRLLHLVWAPLGIEALRAFLTGLAEHPAGRDAARTAVLNGFASRDDAREHLALLEGWDVAWTSRSLLDLGAYAEAARAVREPHVCLLNSYARPLAGDWLAKLCAPVEDGRAAAAGATGSWESLGSTMRLRHRFGAARHWRDRAGACVDWFALRARFPRFPNPHLRSQGVVLARDVLLDVVREPPRDKAHSYAMESGRRGLSRRAGGPLVVVDRDGVAHAPDAWPASRTFRSGEQERLLIADNRTREWDDADPATRAGMMRRVWGRG